MSMRPEMCGHFTVSDDASRTSPSYIDVGGHDAISVSWLTSMHCGTSFGINYRYAFLYFVRQTFGRDVFIIR